MARRRSREVLVAVGMNDDSSSYLIFESDVAACKKIYLTHLTRTGNKPEALVRAHATKAELSRWRRDDLQFREDEQHAVYVSSAKFINKIAQAAMKGDPKAAMYLAERLNPEDMGKVVEHAVLFDPPPRLSRPNIREIKTKEKPVDEVEGEYREVDDATAETAGTRHAHPESPATGVGERRDRPAHGTALHHEPGVLERSTRYSLASANPRDDDDGDAGAV